MRKKVRGQTQVPAKLTVEASNFGCDRAANGNTVGEGELSTAVVVRTVYSESRRTLLLCTTAWPVWNHSLSVPFCRAAFLASAMMLDTD